jgi:hypothetical protein
MPDSNNSIYSHWGVIKHGVPQGSVLGPLLFFIHIDDLPPTINTHCKIDLFANNIIISHPGTNCFQNCMKDVFATLNNRIKIQKLTFNFDKTNFIKNNKGCFNLNIRYDDNKSVEEAETTTFLGLQIDNNLNLKSHIQ